LAPATPVPYRPGRAVRRPTVPSSATSDRPTAITGKATPAPRLPVSTCLPLASPHRRAPASFPRPSRTALAPTTADWSSSAAVRSKSNPTADARSLAANRRAAIGSPSDTVDRNFQPVATASVASGSRVGAEDRTPPSFRLRARINRLGTSGKRRASRSGSRRRPSEPRQRIA